MEIYDFSEYRRVYLSIHIKPEKSTTMKPVRFKVDTGADLTTISKDELYALGYTLEWIKENSVSGTSSTADGSTFMTGFVQLPVINFLGYEGKNWPLLVILDEEKDFHNLLGRDLLSGFNYNFNNDKEIFEIRRAEKFYFIGEKLSSQEIHEVATQKTKLVNTRSSTFDKRK